MYKDELAVKGFNLGNLNADEKKQLNYILSLEAKVKVLHLADDSDENDSEIEKYQNLVDSKKREFEKLLSVKSTDIEDVEQLADEPNHSTEKTNNFGLFALIGSVIIGGLILLSGNETKQ